MAQRQVEILGASIKPESEPALPLAFPPAESQQQQQQAQPVADGMASEVVEAAGGGGGENAMQDEQELEAKRDPTAFRITTVRPAFHTGIDLLSAEEIEKRKKRAQRYGTAFVDPTQRIDQTLAVPADRDPGEEAKLAARRAKYGIVDQSAYMNLNSPYEQKEQLDLSQERRRDTIHVYGSWLSPQSTNSVLKAFDEYGPSHVEWISGTRCNVVFADPQSAARALLFLSKLMPSEYKAVEPQVKSLNLNPEEAKLWCWRLGNNSNEQSVQMLRIATVFDVKKPPEQRGMSGAKSLFAYYQKQNQQAQQRQQYQQRRQQSERARARQQQQHLDDNAGERVHSNKKARKRNRKKQPYSTSERPDADVQRLASTVSEDLAITDEALERLTAPLSAAEQPAVLASAAAAAQQGSNVASVLTTGLVPGVDTKPNVSAMM